MGVFSEVERAVSAVERNIRNRFNNMIRRAVVELVDDSTKLQILGLSVLKNEPQDEVEHFEHYGLTTSPPKGAEAIVLRIGGAGDVQAVIATAYRQGRPKLATQEDVTLWHKIGHKIELQVRKIVITLNDPGDKLELGAGATKGVNREGDNVLQGAALKTWMDAVTIAAPVPPFVGTSLGATDTGSVVVKAVD